MFTRFYVCLCVVTEIIKIFDGENVIKRSTSGDKR